MDRYGERNKMLAYVYNSDRNFVLKDVPYPRPKIDSIVIKVNICSICGTDFRTYIYGNKKITPPRVVGHEVCGTIDKVGKNVKGFYTGDRVAVAPAIGCGECYMCVKGYTNMCSNLKTIGFQYDGGFAEYMEIPGSAFKMGNVYKLSNLIEDQEAALVEPIACVINAQEFLKIKKGDYVAIFGSGFIGCIHAELAFVKGAEKVIIIEMVKNRADVALKLLKPVGEIQMINPINDNTVEEMRKLTGGRGIDVAITACSSGKAQEDAIKISAKRGRISLFGGIVGEARGFIDSNEVHYKELSVYGAHASTPLQNKTAIEWISNRNLKVKKYISRIYPLNNIVEAFEAIKNENIMKAIIKT